MTVKKIHISNKLHTSIIFLLFLLFASTFVTFGANFTTYDLTDAQWSDDATWNGSNSPGSNLSSLTNITINGRIIADYPEITVAKTGSITVTSGSTLVITGILTSAKENSIIVEAGASLVIMGDYGAAKDLFISNAGTVIFLGDVSSAKDAIITSDSPTSEFYVLGTLDLGSGSTMIGDSVFIQDTAKLVEKQPDLINYLLETFPSVQTLLETYIPATYVNIIYAIANGNWSDQTTVWSRDGVTACSCKPVATDSVVIAGFTIGMDEDAVIEDLVINNASNLDLVFDGVDNSLTITASLSLINGYITTNSTNILILAEGVTITGGSDNSFVDGPVQRVTNSTSEIIFPVGDGGVYAPLGIALTSATTSDYTVEYFATPYSDINTIQSESGIVNISTVEYWDIHQNSGVGVNVTMYYLDVVRSSINDITQIVLAHWTGTEWENLNRISNTANSVTAGPMTSFSPITGGGSSGSALPVELVNFTASYYNGRVNIEWATASEKNNDYFTIERSLDGIFFDEITVVEGIGNSSVLNVYNATDYEPLAGEVYYRLKQTDFDGTTSYSKVVAVRYNSKLSMVKNTMKVYPNPLKEGDDLSLTLITTEDVVIEVFNSNGTRLYFDEYFTGGEPEIEIEVDFIMGFPSGNYIVKATTATTALFENVIIK